MQFLEIVLAIVSGSILYTVQTALKYMINKDRIWNLKIWLTTNWKVWLYSLGGSIASAAAFVYMPEWSALIGTSFGIELDGSTGSFILAGTALGALIKSQVETFPDGK